MLGDQRFKLIAERRKALGEIVARPGRQLTVGDVREPVAVRLDQPPAGGAEAGIKAELWDRVRLGFAVVR